jgi:phospholipid transport system substrate-binding protein
LVSAVRVWGVKYTYFLFLLRGFIMHRRFFNRLLPGLLCGAMALAVVPASAADEAADVMIQRLSTEVLDSIRTDASIKAGDLSRIIALVDSKIMPNVNFQRMTASAVGPSWRRATPEQQRRLQEEFKILLVRTYAGALSQVSDQVVVMKPMRAAPEDKEVVVRTEVRGHGDPIQLDYRLEKTPGQGPGWKIYDLNVLGAWLVQTYKTQFAQEVNAKGINGLIDTLADRNKANAKKG